MGKQKRTKKAWTRNHEKRKMERKKTMRKLARKAAEPEAIAWANSQIRKKRRAY